MKIIQKNFLASYIIIAVLALGSPQAFSQVSLSIVIAPPPLQVDAQPVCPGDGYLWTPGYWAYDDSGYYWVPGAWVQPPQAGLFWTPGYWGYNGSDFAFNSGYWGPNVGFYGGINYGYGYGGNGYNGGRWQGGHFSYNTAVNNVSSANSRYTYADKTAINNNTGKVSYNGGKGGVRVQATAQERQFSSQKHIQPTSAQQAQVQTASKNRSQSAQTHAPVKNAAEASSTGEPVRPPAQPQPKEINPQPATTVHSQVPTQEQVEPQHEPAQTQQPARPQEQPQREPAQAQQPARPQEQPQPNQEAPPSQQAPQQTHDTGPAR